MEGGHGWLIQSDEGKHMYRVLRILITKYAHDNQLLICGKFAIHCPI